MTTIAASLPLPALDARPWGAHRLFLHTDDALFDAVGVLIAFTGRAGGASVGAWEGLNLGTHVKDDPAAVAENRRRLMDVLGVADAPLIVPNQVHGTNLVDVDSASADDVEAARAAAQEGADGIVCGVSNVAALLCFADCLPLVIVSPTGRFAVAHAGWRGAVAGIAGAAVRRLAHADAAQGIAPASYNAYIGPYIHVECFETGADVAQRFVDAYGADVAPDPRHVDLGRAVATDLVRAGCSPDRIADAGACTRCNPDVYYSYRASGGVCGRHGAFAIRRK